MDPYSTLGVAGMVLGGFVTFMLAYAWAARRARARKAASPAAAAGGLGDPYVALRQAERRIDDLEATLSDLAERLEAVAGSGSEERLQALSGSLVALIRDKNATLETALGGIDQLRGRLRALEQIGDPAEARGLFERLGVRIDELQAAQAAQLAATEARLAALQGELTGPGPHAAIAEQLTRLYAQKDATVETVFARLAPLEVKLAGLEEGLARRDPQGELARFAERLEAGEARFADRLAAAQAEQDAREGGFAARLEALEAPQENPFAEISDQLTRLYAQKDATVETVFARLAPLEVKLAGLEEGLARRDPQGELARFAERLEAGEARFADRLAALEIEGAVADPHGALDDLAARVAALQTAQEAAEEQVAALQAAAEENPAGQFFTEISHQLARLAEQKDAAVAAVSAQLAPLEARLAELEARPLDGTEDAARAEAQAIATQMIAARAAAEQTEIFANRLTALEASLPRLTVEQSRMVRALERVAASAAVAPPVAEAAAASATGEEADQAGETEGLDEIDEIWSLSRIVSMHHK